jgi:hypothetical protein
MMFLKGVMRNRFGAGRTYANSVESCGTQPELVRSKAAARGPLLLMPRRACDNIWYYLAYNNKQQKTPGELLVSR